MSGDGFDAWMAEQGGPVTRFEDGAEVVVMTRAEALKIPHAEPLVNGRCVGHTEYDERWGTVLVMDWHDPNGCEHEGVGA